MAGPLGLLEAAADIEIRQGAESVLGSAPRHAGGCHDGGDSIRALAYQPGYVEAAVEAGAGLARFRHISSSRRSK